jgi:opacity protein-like surface antigen
MTMQIPRPPSLAFGAVIAGLLCSALPALAQAAPWSTTVYLQQSWPKQTETNRQIKEINATFGTSFKTWDDVANLNLGVQVFRDLDRHWKLGVEFDYSRGRISGSSSIETLAGPANLAFEQKYTMYADLLAMAQYRPLGAGGRWVPFLQAGFGVAYEKDETHLTLRNHLLDDALNVENSGWFPMLTAGAGLDVFLNPRRTCYAEFGISYSWARLKHAVPASGSLAPAPTVTADTDSTGPNLWLGIGWRF